MQDIDLQQLKFTFYAFDRVQVGKWWNFKNHISRFARIYLIEEGEQEVSFQGKKFTQTPGHVYLMPPFTPVDYLCHKSCIQYYLIFTVELADGSDLFSHFDFNYEQKSAPIHVELCRRLQTVVPNLRLSNVDADDKSFKSEIFDVPYAILTPHQQMEIQGIVHLLLRSI